MIFRSIGRTVVQNLPTIMTIAGCTVVVAGSVLACKATLKADEVLAENRAKIESVRESGIASEKVYRKELTKGYISGGVNWVKLYGPSALLIGFGVGSILYGHNILKARNLAVIGAYKALTIEHQEYRNKMKEVMGSEEERKIYYDLGELEIGNMEDGETHKVSVIVEPSEPEPNWNEHAKFFCESSIYFSKNPEENLKFLMDTMGRMQEKFDRQGYLFLNDVYRALDIPETYGGSVCGWIKGLGDNVIDFGIFDCYKESSHRFVNGYEPVVLLDFNHDGYIADKL